jgi:tetrahydromethanopterin S-methyltransferase subunit G
LLTFFRRLFVQAPAIRELRERLSNVEADLEWLALEVKRVRGRVTGGIRTGVAGDGAAKNGAEPPVPTHLPAAQRAWLERLDPISRKIQLQRLAGSTALTEFGRQVKGGG